MKLSEYAQKMGIHYKTAWWWWKAGKLPGFQQDTGTVIVYPDQPALPHTDRVAIYVRVSAAENRLNLDSQAERLLTYCIANGYQIQQVVKEVGSGVNDRRPKFLKLLVDGAITVIVVEHKDRATRFGFRYLETLLAQQGRRIEVVNLADNGKEDLIGDMVAIVYSFSARLYGQRRAKHKTDVIKAVLEREDQDAVSGATSD
jgi:predicted site-specific integrase-resolvase